MRDRCYDNEQLLYRSLFFGVPEADRGPHPLEVPSPRGTINRMSVRVLQRKPKAPNRFE